MIINAKEVQYEMNNISYYILTNMISFIVKYKKLTSASIIFYNFPNLKLEQASHSIQYSECSESNKNFKPVY